MKTRHIVLGGCLLPPLLLVAGCAYLVFFCTQTTHELPREIGIRKDAAGGVVEEILFQANYQRRGRWLGPHGPAWISNKRWFHCYEHEPGKPQRELAFLQSVPDFGPNRCHPVEGTELWAVETLGEPDAEFERTGVQEHGILVFDKTHVVRHVLLDGLDLSSPVKKAFRNGNRQVVYRSTKGWKSLDVLTGQISTVGPPKPMPNWDAER